MAKRGRARRKPASPDEVAEKRARSRAVEDRAMRAEGVDPKIARWNDDGMDRSRVEALERQGFAVVREDQKVARDAGQSSVVVDHRGRQIKASHKADVWQQLFTRDGLTREQLGAVRDLQDVMAKRAGIGGRDEKMAYERDKADEPFRDACLVTEAMLQAGREMDLTLALVGPPSSRLLTALLWPVALGVPNTVSKPMRRCTATVQRELSTPDGGDRRGAWQSMLHDFDDRKRGRTKPRTSIESRVCETLNPIAAKNCEGCGRAFDAIGYDIKDAKNAAKARADGVEMLSVEEDWRDVVARVTGETHPSAQSAPLRIAAQALVDVRADVQRRMKGAKSANANRRDPQGFAEERAEVRTHPFHAGVSR